MANYRDRANVNNQIKNNISLGNYTSINSAQKITPPKTNQVNQGANGNNPKALTADLSGTGQGTFSTSENIVKSLDDSLHSNTLYRGLVTVPATKSTQLGKAFIESGVNLARNVETLTPKEFVGKVGTDINQVASASTELGKTMLSNANIEAAKTKNWYETGRRELPVEYQQPTIGSNTVATEQPTTTQPAPSASTGIAVPMPEPTATYDVLPVSMEQASQPYQQFSGKQQNYLPSEINDYRGLQNIALGRVVPQTTQGGLVNRTNQVGNVNTLSFANERTGGTGSIQFSDGRTLSPEQMKSLQERLNYQNTDQAEANRIRDAQVVADRERSYDAYLRQKDLRDSMSNVPMTRFNQALRMQKEANDLEAAKITALGKVQEAQIKDQSLADYRQAETVRKDRQQALGEAMMGIKAIEEKEKSTGMPVSLKSAFSTMMSYPGSDLETTRRFLSSKLGADPQFNALKEAYDTGDEDTKNEIYKSLGFTRKEIDFADKAMITEY
jgi:hypothetical protein